MTLVAADYRVHARVVSPDIPARTGARRGRAAAKRADGAAVSAQAAADQAIEAAAAAAAAAAEAAAAAAAAATIAPVLGLIGSHTLGSEASSRWIETSIALPDPIADGDVFYLEAAPAIFSGLVPFRGAKLRDETTAAVDGAAVVVDGGPAGVAVEIDYRGGEAIGLGKTASGNLAIAFESASAFVDNSVVSLYRLR